MIDIINTIAGTMLGGLMAVFLLGMFVPRANAPGVSDRTGFGGAAVAACLISPQIWISRPDDPASGGTGLSRSFPRCWSDRLASYLFAPPEPNDALWYCVARSANVRVMQERRRV